MPPLTISPKINPNNIGIAINKPPILGHFQPSPNPINISGKTVSHVLSTLNIQD